MSYYKDILNQNENGHKLTDSEIKQIQECLLILLEEIMEVCKKYDIRPMLLAGNLIGKVRHDGFIPWDDDLDLAMVREDYDKFSQVFDKELSDRYVISDPVGNHEAFNRFIQVGRKGTKLKSVYQGKEDEARPTQHIYIDIFPLDYAPNNKVLRIFKGFYANMIMMIAGCVSFKSNKNAFVKNAFKRSLRGKLELRFRKMIGTICSFRSPSWWFHYVDKVVRSSNPSDYIVLALGRKHYFGDMDKTDIVLPLKESDYYGIPVYVPNNVHEYLTKGYGNYMEIPSEDKRESHHAIEFQVLDK